VEIDKFCQRVLKKHWPEVPIVEDVNEVERIVAYAKHSNGSELQRLRELPKEYTQPANNNLRIDLITGGVPCQPSSYAGKRKGTEDDRWLWPAAIKVVDRIQPRWVLFENPTGFLTLNKGVEYEAVLAHLEAQGYWVESFIIPASATGAPHRRDRVWIVARHSKCDGRQSNSGTLGGRNRLLKNGEYETNSENGQRFRNEATRADSHAPDSNGLRPEGQCRGWEEGVAECDYGDAPDSSEPGLQELEHGPTSRQTLEPETGAGLDNRPERQDSHAPDSCCNRLESRASGNLDNHSNEPAQYYRGQGQTTQWEHHSGWESEHWYEAATRLCRVPNGVSRGVDRVNRLKALGNSVCVPVVAEILRAIKQAEEGE
jgi:DNA (cytosine-5)-methyltransferase 1